MKDDLPSLLQEMASNPISYGIGAAVARFAIGEQQKGWKTFLEQVVASCFVAFVVTAYLNQEGYAIGTRTVYVCILAFLGRDVLMALILIGSRLREDPIGFLVRLKESFKGAPK
jgi:hypothetical protein